MPSLSAMAVLYVRGGLTGVELVCDLLLAFSEEEELESVGWRVNSVPGHCGGTRNSNHRVYEVNSEKFVG